MFGLLESGILSQLSITFINLKAALTDYFTRKRDINLTFFTRAVIGTW